MRISKSLFEAEDERDRFFSLTSLERERATRSLDLDFVLRERLEDLDFDLLRDFERDLLRDRELDLECDVDTDFLALLPDIDISLACNFETD